MPQTTISSYFKATKPTREGTRTAFCVENEDNKIACGSQGGKTEGVTKLTCGAPSQALREREDPIEQIQDVEKSLITLGQIPLAQVDKDLRENPIETVIVEQIAK